MIRRLKWLAAVLSVAMCSGTASAFYFPGWPGAAVRPPAPSIITSYTAGDPPSVRQPITVQPSGGNPGGGGGGGGNNPSSTPEPSTLLLAGIGIGVIVRRARRKAM